MFSAGHQESVARTTEPKHRGEDREEKRCHGDHYNRYASYKNILFMAPGIKMLVNSQLTLEQSC